MAFASLDVTERCRTWIESVLGSCSVGPPMSGATTATVVPIVTDAHRFVLKWFTWDRFVREDPDRARHEAFGLEVARTVGIPAAQLVALDPDGVATGHPALLMTALTGAPLPRPADWPAQAADAAAQLHAAEVDVPYAHGRYVPDPFTPAWASDRRLWDDAIAAVRGLAVEDDAVIHRDLHRWNMLWDDRSLTGVLDWLSVCRGPVGEDVGRVWINEVLEGEGDQGELFREAYAERSGRTWDARWEVQTALDMLPAYESVEAVHVWGTPASRSRLEACLRVGLEFL